MSKGLKQEVADALAELEEAGAPTLPPVDISGEAFLALSTLMRRWSDWPKSHLILGKPDPKVSPWASTDMAAKRFTVNIDALLLNPNRVLRRVTPFRLRQEAVLTGVMLHEAGHARFSHWMPTTNEEAATWVHGTGSIHAGEAPSVPTVKFARLLEEARIEGHIARVSRDIGASGLTWTMRASTAALLPMTDLSSDPDQQIMDIIASFVLRAGKRLAEENWLSAPGSRRYAPPWCTQFQTFVNSAVLNHMIDVNGVKEENTAKFLASRVMDGLTMMMISPAHDDRTYMIDTARDVLDMLFPETPPEQMPQPSGGCGACSDEGEGGGQPQPSDQPGDQPGEGSEAGENGADTDEQGVAEAEAQRKEKEAAEALAKKLSEMEGKSSESAKEEGEQCAKQMREGGLDGGEGGNSHGEWRKPTPDEREMKKDAEKFLRSLIEPNNKDKMLITDTPSSLIDGAAMAAWKASGGVRAPRFFKHTKRVVQPAPPVQIAVLVDISSSMDVMQLPSAQLSWALSSAAFDLRNFAGRGVQIESCLIHWGSSSYYVVQENGKPLTGLRTVRCSEGTTALPEAFELVEEQMPGFFDIQPEPRNRLLVTFTDWRLHGGSEGRSVPGMRRMLEAGVNVLSVVPKGYSPRFAALPNILAQCPTQVGRSEIAVLEPGVPFEMVWRTAADMLNGRTISPFAGF